MENLLPADGAVYYYPSFFSRAESDIFLNTLLQTVPWKQEPVLIFGKQVMQPRLTAWYGDPGRSYRYSGIVMEPLPWIDPLPVMRQRIEAISGAGFNSALLNWYRHQQDSMGWHRDNEKELGRNPVIASISLGATRPFLLRRYDNKQQKISIDLEHGSLLLMQGATQHYWEHSLPKRTRTLGDRVNITFRKVAGRE